MTQPLRYSVAWALRDAEVLASYGCEPDIVWNMAGRMFVRSPEFDTPTECWSWLFEQGVHHSDGRIERGASGRWRGSGQVSDG